MVQKDNSQELLALIEAQIALVARMPDTVAGKSTEKVRSSLDRFYGVLKNYFLQNGCIATVNGGIRKSPSTTAERLGSLENENRLVDGQTIGDDDLIWYRVQPEQGWVRSDIATLSGNCGNIPFIVNEGKVEVNGCVAYIGQQTNIRSGPGWFRVISSEIGPVIVTGNYAQDLASLANSTNPEPGEVLGEWIEIQMLDGRVGWVHRNSIELGQCQVTTDMTDELHQRGVLTFDPSVFPDPFSRNWLEWVEASWGYQLPYIPLCLLRVMEGCEPGQISNIQNVREEAALSSLQLQAFYRYYENLPSGTSPVEAMVAWVNYYEHGTLDNSASIEYMQAVIMFDLLGRWGHLDEAEFDAKVAELQTLLTTSPLENAALWDSDIAQALALWGSEWTVLLSRAGGSNKGDLALANYRDPQFIEDYLLTPLETIPGTEAFSAATELGECGNPTSYEYIQNLRNGRLLVRQS